jgi:hypothetical protein
MKDIMFPYEQKPLEGKNNFDRIFKHGDYKNMKTKGKKNGKADKV